jgi:hypothetical protein
MKQVKLTLAGLLLTAQLGFAMQPELAANDISGLDKKELLRALYENALLQEYFGCVPGGFLSDRDIEKALAKKEIDYLHGRAIKTNLFVDTLYTAIYNRENGQGKAEKVIAQLRAKQLQEKK